MGRSEGPAGSVCTEIPFLPRLLVRLGLASRGTGLDSRRSGAEQGLCRDAWSSQGRPAAGPWVSSCVVRTLQRRSHGNQPIVSGVPGSPFPGDC